MGIIRNILVHILIIAILSTSGVFSAFAEDEAIILHSLDELPSIQNEKGEKPLDIIEEKTGGDEDEGLSNWEDEGEISWIMTLPEYNESTDVDAWFDQMSSLVRMGIIKRRILRSLSLPWNDKTISVHILEGTKIRTKNYDDIPIDMLSVDATATEKKKWIFHFGLTGKHLIFSKPVEVEMRLKWANDGSIKTVRVKHAGDREFNTIGLSTNPDTKCNTDGTATIPSNSAVVQDGKIKFYTCGASAFLIDDTSNPPTWAYSLRKLSSSYTWSAIRVRRSSDNTEQDIGFTNNELNTWALLSFVGSWNWFVTIWYDQSGNWRNATQTTQSSQPYIVQTWVIPTRNNKPIIRYTVEWQWLNTTARVLNWSAANAITISYSANDGNKTPFSLNGSNQSQRFTSHASITWDYTTPTGAYSRLSFAATPTTYKTQTFLYSTTQNLQAIYENGTIRAQTTAWVSTTFDQWTLQIGATLFPSPYKFTGDIGEVIVFGDTNVSSDQRKIIEQHQAGYFGISGSFIPTEPINLKAIPWDSRVQLSWSPPTNSGWSAITDYIIQYKLSVWSLWATINDGVSSSTTFTLTGITNRSIYDFRVAAINSTGTGWYSSMVTASPFLFAESELWLRAWSGTSCSTDGCSVSSWWDSSGKDNNANQSTSSNQPIYTLNKVNNNPIIQFNSTNQYLQSTKTGTYQTIFAVRDLKPNTPWQTLFAAPANADFSIRADWSTGNSYVTSPNSNDWWFGWTLAINSKITTTIWPVYHILRDVSAAKQVGQNYSISSTFMWRWMTWGNGVAEILVYSGVVSNWNTDIIESYLAIKYGITRDQTTAKNYVYSNGSIVWNATTGWTYKNDIAGIGRDDDTTLNQKKSQSINNPGDIIVEFTGATLTNMRWITWANDGTATGTWINTENPPGYRRINREWKFQEPLWDVGNVKLSYPASSVPLWSTGSIYALVDIDGNFSSGSTAITGSLIGGNYEFSMNIGNGAYITFGYKDITPPTLSLSGNVMSGRLMPIGKWSIILSYDDTESWISTGSLSLTLEKWNSSLGSYDAATSSGLIESWTRTITWVTWSMSGVSYGKYRLTASISDRWGNQTSTGFVFFVDGVDWTISSDRYALGDLASWITTFGTGSLTITVKTVWAGFTLTSSAWTNIVSGTNTINYWNGSKWWGYDTWNGSSWTNTVTTPSPTYTIANVSQNINQNGDRNIYTYTLRYGANIDAAQVAGNYTGTLNFWLNFTY
jgi:hypothetical protein